MSNIVPYTELKLMAKDIAEGGLFGLRKTEQIATLMLVAQSEGISPVRAMSMYDIIQGKPALKSSEILARFQDAGGMVEWLETNEKVCKGKFTHAKGGTITIEWTWERAAKADLVNKDNWKKFPAQMLRARCVSEAVRAIYPRCLNNLYTVEEVQDEITYTEAEVIVEQEAVRDIQNIKRAFAKKLKDFGFNSAMITEFATIHKLIDDVEKIEELMNDEPTLIKLIEEYEK